MCGRYSVTSAISLIKKHYNINKVDADTFRNIFNAAPTQQLPVITNNEPHKIQFFRWGLIPFWAKDTSIGSRMINARVETLLAKVSFKNLLKKNRCLVIADGFYEWKKTRQGKQPYRITLKSNEPYSYAGLWSEWTNKETGEIIKSFTIITTESNDLIKPIHNRMPLILKPENEDKWLTDGLQESEYIKLLEPIPSHEMQMYRISDLVNSPKNNTPDIINPLET